MLANLGTISVAVVAAAVCGAVWRIFVTTQRWSGRWRIGAAVAFALPAVAAVWLAADHADDRISGVPDIWTAVGSVVAGGIVLGGLVCARLVVRFTPRRPVD